MKKILILTLLWTVLFPACLSAQKDITFPDSQFRDITDQDFSTKYFSSDFYNELWTYHIQLENGVQVIYSFSINNFGSFKNQVTGAKLVVSWKNGKTYVVNKEYNLSDLTNQAENKYLRLHPDRPYWAKGSFEKEHVLNFLTSKGGVSYDLNLTLFDINKGRVLGDGVYKIKNDEIGIYMLIPHARVKGYVEINGERIKAEGTAYMDHIYQNNLSTKLIEESYRVKSGDARNGFFFHYMTVKSSGEKIPIGYGIRYEEGTETLLTPSEIKTLSTTGVRGIKLAERLMVKSYQMDSLNIAVDKHLNTFSMMDPLGGFQKFFAKRVTGGELIEMNGTLTINEQQDGYFYYMVADN